MQYELQHSTGNLDGPYHSKLAAKVAALQSFTHSVSEIWVDIMICGIKSDRVARITRDDYYMVVDELGQVKSKKAAKINMAQFEVKATVILYGVEDIELNNSEVLHPDVLDQLHKNLEDGISRNIEITLDEVFELDIVKD